MDSVKNKLASLEYKLIDLKLKLNKILGLLENDISPIIIK